jgi:hypothetical protein
LVAKKDLDTSYKRSNIAGMANNRINKYRELDKLPAEAITVNQYAKQRNCNTSYIYKLWAEHRDKGKTIPFEIVKIRDINFVLPV